MTMKGEKLMWSALPVVELSDLISPDPVDRGLYVARHEDVSPAHVMSHLVSLLAFESNAEKKFRKRNVLLICATRRYGRGAALRELAR